MTTFWSLYITVLTLGTLAALTWLLFSTRKGQRRETTEETVGHVYDGIEEYDNPLPRWWFLLFIGTLVFALGYLALYPGLGNFKGLLPGYDYVDADKQVPFANGQTGWSAVHEWEKEMARADARFGPIYARFAAMPVAEVARDPQALKMGERLFASNCAVCHGADARGAFGYPNLTDADWRWGGEPDTIKQTIMNGRHAMMPGWAQVLGEQGVTDVAAFVVHGLGGRDLPTGIKADPENGRKLYSTTCIACHGPEGKGTPAMGAPNLTHPQAFIYGSNFAQVAKTVREGRQGQMPAQAQTQGNDRVHLLAAYVYNLSHKDE